MNWLLGGNGVTATNIPSGVTVNGNGSGNPSFIGNPGVAGTITLNFNNTSGITFQWDGSFTGWGTNGSPACTGGGRFYMVRQSDLAAYNAGTYWASEPVYLLRQLYPESLRMMGLNALNFNIWTNVTNFNYRETPQAIMWGSGQIYPPGERCGGPTSWCTISVSGGALTAAAAADTNLSGWTDGEQISGNVASGLTSISVSGVGSNGGNCQLTVNSTTGMSANAPVFVLFINGATECNSQATTILSVDDATHLTINIPKGGGVYTNGGSVGFQTLSVTGKSGGPVLIADFIAGPIGSGFDTFSSGNTTFTYNSVLNKLIYNNGSIGNSIPIEAQVQLANLVGANYWYNVPAFTGDSFVTSASNLIYANLKPPLHMIWERGNECWNFGQGCAQWMTQMGIALGIATNTPQPFQSLRNVKDYNLVAASNWSGAMSRVERAYCFQAGFGGTGFATGPMSGASLVSPGSAAYQAYAGGATVNFNTFPNRPIDKTDTICYAPYVGGGTAFSGQSPDTGSTPTIYDAPLLQNVVNAQVSGAFGTAYSLIDQSVRGDVQNRVQTVTCSGTTWTTPAAHNFSNSDALRLTVSGGTTYSSLNLQSVYQVLSTTSNTFTMGQVVNGAVGAAIGCGTAGSGTTSVGDLGGNGGSFNNLSIFALESDVYSKYQNMVTTGFSPAPSVTPTVRWYEGNLEPTVPSISQLGNIGVIANSQTVTSLGTNTVCMGSMPYVTNESLAFTSAGSITGISIDTNYFAVNISGNCMGIATSSGGGALTLGGTAGGAVVGSTTAANSNLTNALLGWKFNGMAAATTQFYYQSFLGSAANRITSGAMPNSKSANWLVVMNGGVYGMVDNFSYTAPVPRGYYAGFQACNTGGC